MCLWKCCSSLCPGTRSCFRCCTLSLTVIYTQYVAIEQYHFILFHSHLNERYNRSTDRPLCPFRCKSFWRSNAVEINVVMRSMICHAWKSVGFGEDPLILSVTGDKRCTASIRDNAFQSCVNGLQAAKATDKSRKPDCFLPCILGPGAEQYYLDKRKRVAYQQRH